MGTSEITGVTCKGCGAQRSKEVVNTSPRPPCPTCCETAIEVGVTITSVVKATASMEAALQPGEQERMWERRWKDAQAHLDRLLVPRPGPLSAEAIHAANEDLQAFYVQTYHIKDSLKSASASTGVSGRTIENEIDNNPDLALLADLCNLDKHGQLTKLPRSGDVPKIASMQGSTSSYAMGSGEWRLDVEIEHKGNRLDGLDVAKRSIAAWRSALQKWNLV